MYLGDMMSIDSGPLYRRVIFVQTTDNDHFIVMGDQRQIKDPPRDS